MGAFLKEHGDPEAAIRHYVVALALQEKRGNRAEMIIFLGNLAEAHSSLDRGVDAVGALERKLAIQNQVGDQRGAANTMHEIANASEAITPESDAYYARAVEAFTTLEEPMTAVLVEMDRARGWSRIGHHVKALEIGERALARIQLDDEFLAATMDNLGLLYSEANDHARAIDLMRRSLTLVERLDDREGLRVVLCNLAVEYQAMDLEANAIESYVRALPLAQQADDREAISMVLDELGELHASIANDAPAIAFTRRALAMYEQDGKHDDAARLRLRLERLERSISKS